MTDYILRKIKNIEGLLEKCTENQKLIYEGYLDFWKNKLSKEPNPEDNIDYEALFIAKNPNKKAYYKRNGVIYKTKAFQEFLKSKE